MLSYRYRLESGVVGLLGLWTATILPVLGLLGTLDPNELLRAAAPAVFSVIAAFMIRYAFGYNSDSMPRWGGDRSFWIAAAAISAVALVLTMGS